jgi:hypothetical protein
MKQEQYIYIDKDGDKYYYKDRAMTIRHRLDGPGVEYADGTKAWYVDGKPHRTDGPACEYTDGYKAWYVDGKLHRLDGPAYEGADGHKAYFVDGKRHRHDGPAVEYADGHKAWFVNGKELSEEQFNALTAPLELTLDEIAAKYGVDVSKVKIIK